MLLDSNSLFPQDCLQKKHQLFHCQGGETAFIDLLMKEARVKVKAQTESSLEAVALDDIHV